MSTLSVTLTGIAPATLTLELGTPGPQGSTGPAGPTGPAGSQGIPGVGVPAGGTAGQFLTKIDGTNYNTDWTTVNLAAYAPLASPLFTGDPRGPTAALGDNDTSLATTAFVQQELLSGTANARNLELLVRNQSGSTIASGSIVYISGATGNLPLITLAQANNDTNSAQTIGFVKTAIANNGTGFVIIRGVIENLDTSALTEGVQLYLSPTTAGTWTITKPSAPQHMVYVGICVRSHPTLGTIVVAVQNGYELHELHDVAITSPTNGQVLKYDSAQSLWVNGTDASGVAWGAITGTLTSQTDLNTALGLKYDASNPSGFITASALSPYLLSATASATYQTLAGMSSYLTTSAAAASYYPLTGNPSGFLTSAPVTSVAGRTGAITLSNTDISGLGTMSTVNDAPSDGSTYGRNNGAWVAAGGGSTFTGGPITSPITYVSGDNNSTFASTVIDVTRTAAGGGLPVRTTNIDGDKLIAYYQYDDFGVTRTDSALYNYKGFISYGTSSSLSYTFDVGYTNPGYIAYTETLMGSPSVSLTLNPGYISFYSPSYGSAATFGLGGLTFSDGTTQTTASTATNPPYTNAIWYGGAWYSANVNSVTDGYGNYYNVLTI